jgi:Tol biopolymer transport system component
VSARTAVAIVAAGLAVAGAVHAFPGTNGRLAYFYANEIWVMNADGTGTRSLGAGLSPSWSPNGRRLVFDAVVDRNYDVWTMAGDGGARRRVTTNAAPDYFATWSPNGEQIAFTSDRGGEDLFVIDADGTNERRLTGDPGPEWGAAWSPDGGRIVFAGNARGNLEIEVVSVDGSGRVALTDHRDRDYDPAWSPDGTRIAFTSERDGNANVYVMNADGSGVTQLTDDPAGDFRPAWSPDGRTIAFESTRDPAVFDRDVYVMNADGSDERRLRSGDVNARDVDWQPTVDLQLRARRSGRFVVAQVTNRSPADARRVRLTFTFRRGVRVRQIGTIPAGSSRTARVASGRRTTVLASGWQVDPNPADNRASVSRR